MAEKASLSQGHGLNSRGDSTLLAAFISSGRGRIGSAMTRFLSFQQKQINISLSG